MKLRFVAHLDLSYTCDIPGAVFPPVLAVARPWSANRRFSRPARAWRAEGALVLYARARFLPLPWRPRLAPGGRQVPLVFSAWDSATRNAATAVVNNGGSTPPAPPAPCQVISQVIVAVAWNAPPGCPALELV
jgi:hypothetical protein